jgi:hypothetical protein
MIISNLIIFLKTYLLFFISHYYKSHQYKSLSILINNISAIIRLSYPLLTFHYHPLPTTIFTYSNQEISILITTMASIYYPIYQHTYPQPYP